MKTGKYFDVKRLEITVFLLLSLLVLAPPAVQAQSFDYEQHPKLDFDFTSLELDLGLQPQNLLIDGLAQYQIRANIAGADTVTLYASHIDVSSVQIDGSSADYHLQNDSLFIALDEPARAGQQFQLSVRYSGGPRFGLLKNNNNTVWTSQLPGAQRHWVPIVDNPHVTLKTVFNISVPSGFHVWATGQKTGQEAASVDVVTYHFASNGEVPASALAFAVGRFSNQVTSGDPRINLAVESDLEDSVDTEALLQSAQGYLSEVGKRLQLGYPFGSLNVIVMADHAWETKSWGASSVFIYKNRGNLQAQLLRGIIGQWFGIYQRESQWSQGDAITLYQTLLQKEMADSSLFNRKDVPEEAPHTVYDVFGVKRWNQWQKKLSQWQPQPMLDIFAGAGDSVLTDLSSVISWDDYAEYWYARSGQPQFDLPAFNLPAETPKDTALASKTNGSPTADSVAYDVHYTLDEAKGQLKLRFSASEGMYSDLTTINAYEIYPDTTEAGEITFTGTRDSVIVQVSPMINTFRLQAPDHPKLKLDEYKPASFLLFDMRNARTVKERTEAARKLGHHANNPDLQLAIKDFMSRDLEPEVEAALLSSFADITQGASGTEQTLLEAVKSENPNVRNAALTSLQHYKNNPSIRKQVKDMALNADSKEMFKKATKVLTAITNSEEFKDFVTTVTGQDTVGYRSIIAIQQLANMGEVEEAVKRAGLFLEDNYRYDVRSTAFGVLIQHDQTPSNWLTRAKDLLQVPDPRIRFLTVQALQRNRNQKISEYLREYIQDEYDARVHQEIVQMLR